VFLTGSAAIFKSMRHAINFRWMLTSDIADRAASST
jgi:hypothetical protein